LLNSAAILYGVIMKLLQQNVHYLIIFLVIGSYSLSVQGKTGEQEHQWMTVSQEHINIFYNRGDSLNASQALVILGNAFNEISHDLRVKPNGDISVFLCASHKIFKQLTLGRLPKWAEGVADIYHNSMVIKSPIWDRSKNDFAGTLVHELTHLLFHQAVGNRSIPRWIDEGLAIFYSREKEWASATQISKALLTHSIIPLQDIDRVLTFHQEKAKLAYQESYTAVQYLLAVYDIDAIHTIIDGIRQGWSWDDTFRRATGSTFSEFETEWYKHIEKEYRWYFLVEIDNYIWFVIIGLLIFGIIIIRLRNRRTLKQWEEEEQAEFEEKQG
jgi:hypothetical protein